MSTADGILSEFEEWREHLAEVESVEAIMAQVREQAETAEREYRLRVAQHEEAMSDAVDRGAPIPAHPDPVPPSFGTAVRRATAQSLEVRQQRGSVLAAIAPEVERRVSAEVEARMVKVREAVADLKEEVPEITGLLRLLSSARYAVVPQNTRPNDATQTRTSVDLHDLVSAVERKIDLTAPRPFSPDGTSRRLGFSGSGSRIERDHGPAVGESLARRL